MGMREFLLWERSVSRLALGGMKALAAPFVIESIAFGMERFSGIFRDWIGLRRGNQEGKGGSKIVPIIADFGNGGFKGRGSQREGDSKSSYSSQPFHRSPILSSPEMSDIHQEEMEDIQKQWEGIKLTEEESGGIQISQEEEAATKAVVDRCLVGSFLTDRPIDFQIMKVVLAGVWKPRDGVWIEEVGLNRYTFQFFSDGDVGKVINGSPWSFKNHQLLLKKLEPGEAPSEVRFSSVPLWVQIFGLPSGMTTPEVLSRIARELGEDLGGDQYGGRSRWRPFQRIRVGVPIEQPIRRTMKLINGGGEVFWISFKFERLPTFCFICGRMGHTDRFCETVGLAPLEKVARQYGVWLQAQAQDGKFMEGGKYLRSGPGLSDGSMGSEETTGDNSASQSLGQAHREGNKEKVGERLQKHREATKGRGRTRGGINRGRGGWKGVGETEVDLEATSTNVSGSKRRRVGEAGRTGEVLGKDTEVLKAGSEGGSRRDK